MTDQVQDTATTTIDGGGTQGADTTTQTAAPATALTTEAAPAEVVYEFKVPDDMSLNEEVADKFKTIAKESKLAPDAAQKVVDLYAGLEKARAEAFIAQVAKWGEEVKADKELGTPENLAAAAKVVQELGTPELRDLLNSTGMGNHPVVVRFMSNVSKALSEDKIVAGRSGGNAPPRDHATILYGNTPT